jgi:Bacterial transcriptional regulator
LFRFFRPTHAFADGSATNPLRLAVAPTFPYARLLAGQHLDGSDTRVSLAGVTSNVSVGSVLPAHATVMGRVMLADLSRRERATLYGTRKLQAYTEHTPNTLPR